MTERTILDMALEALKFYGKHTRLCAARRGIITVWPCDCGFAAAVEAIEKMKDAPPPAGGMVLVPREALVKLQAGFEGVRRHHYARCAIFQPSADETFPKCDCGIGELKTLIDSALAAAPLPTLKPETEKCST